MQILVVSDMHRRKSNFERVLEKYPHIKTIFFLGDGADDAEEIASFFPDKTFNIISGNCDFCSKFPSSRFFNVNGVKILATHGHTYGVKSNRERLFETARLEGVRLVVYGHTHIQMEEYRDGIYMVCPGALGNSTDGPGYAIIDVTQNGIVTNLLKFLF
jgi:putative phosphoesterase